MTIYEGWLQDYIAEIRRSQKSGLKRLTTWGRLRASDERPRYVRAIENEDWAALGRAASRELKARQRSIAAIRRYAAELTGLTNRMPQAYAAVRQVRRPRDRPDYASEASMVRAEMTARGATAAEIAAAFETLDGNPRTIIRTVENALAGIAKRVESFETAHLSSLSGAALARAVAQFNAAYAAPPALRDEPAVYAELVNDAVDAHEKAIWQALRDEDRFIAWAEAVQLRNECARRLFSGALPHAARLAVLRAAAPDDEALGESAIEIGAVIRRLLLGYALGSVLESAVAGPRSGGAFDEWVDGAQQAAAWRSAVKWPRAASLRWLTTQPDAADGTERTIQGRVVSVAISHRGRKAISKVTITDGTHEVVAVLPYIKADSGGMGGGSYARIAGTWRAHSTEAGGPALEISRRSLTALGEAGWHEAATRQVADVFVPVPHALAIEWSWEPGVDGAGNQLRYGTWNG